MTNDQIPMGTSFYVSLRDSACCRLEIQSTKFEIQNAHPTQGQGSGTIFPGTRLKNSNSVGRKMEPDPLSPVEFAESQRAELFSLGIFLNSRHPRELDIVFMRIFHVWRKQVR